MYRLDCWQCEGVDPDCKNCDEHGKVDMFNCPNNAVAEVGADFLHDYRCSKAGLWPIDGGTDEQDELYMRKFLLLDAKINASQSEEMKDLQK